MAKIMRKEGGITPSVAKSEPKKPPRLYPINVAEFIAIGPGVDSAIAITSKNSFFSIHFFFSTSSLSIIAIIA